MSTTHTFECPRCAYNVMGPDADGIADDQSRHEDYHRLADEFAAKNTPRPELADQTTLEVLAEANIEDDTQQPGGGGINARLELHTYYDCDGVEEGTEYYLNAGKARGAGNNPGCRPEQIPDLIAELARLHWIWKRRVEAGADQ